MQMQTFEIKSRWDGRVLYSADGKSLRDVVAQAVREGASLVGASLRNASLDGASLRNASLDGASLDGASLRNASLRNASLVGTSLVGTSLVGASLVGASLDGASLDGASLVGASLDGASLYGASLYGADLVGAFLVGAFLVGADSNKLTLIGHRPVLMLGPLGSRCDYLTAYTTDGGVYVRAGCFFGSLADFRAAVDETHGDRIYKREYAAAIAMIKAIAAIWTPETVAEAA